MSLAAPPEPPRPDELEALIREARAQQQRRRLGLAVTVVILSAIAFGADAIVSGSQRLGHAGGHPVGPATKTGAACGVRVAWTKILGRDGRVLYREPVRRTMGHELRCSGSSISVVFFNGAGMSQEAYTLDDGRTFRRYPVPWPKGSRSASVRVSGRTVTISAHRVEVS